MLDQQDVGLICSTHNNALEGSRNIGVVAVMNSAFESFVEMTLGTESVQMTLEQARLHVRIFVDQTEAAISEGLLIQFIVKKFGAEYAPEVLRAFRQYRHESGLAVGELWSGPDNNQGTGEPEK